MKIYKILALAALCAFFMAGCGGAANLTGKSESPIETVRALHEASQKKDVAEIKKRLSKETLRLFENTALAEKTTVDELLKKDGGAPMQKLPEMREEKVESETTAYVEVKNDMTGDFEKLPLVKEDGQWKVAIDKYLEAMRQRLTEEMNKMKDSSNPSANTESK